MNILIGADIVPTTTNIENFKSAKMEEILGNDLITILSEADYRIFNLEVPLTDAMTPIKKCGVALSAPTECINGIKSLNVNLFTLGNNHIMDQGVQGLESTLSTLKKAEIAYVGAGRSLKEASKPYILECEGKHIGVYACSEHEFSISDEFTSGANPIDYLESFDHVRALKDKCDYVIVLYHGGKEHYRYPSPRLQKCCRKFIDKGADLVICQHSHCIGAKEQYNYGTIVYGQGNFIFDRSDSEYWQTSLLIQITDSFQINYLPLIKYYNGVRIADDINRGEIIANFEKRSMEVKDIALIQRKYNELSRTYIAELLSVSCGIRYGYFIRFLNIIIGNNRLIKYMMKKRFTVNKRLTLLNRIECEAYSELFINALKLSIDEADE